MQLVDTVSALLRLHVLEYGKNVEKNKEVEHLKTTLSDEILHRYEYLKKKYGKTAVVPMKDHVCYGCFVKNATDIKPIEGSVYVCDHCGRLMLDSEETPFYDIYSNEF